MGIISRAKATLMDDRFLITWLFDALFYISVGVVIAASYFGFGSISARIDSLSTLPVTPEVIDAVYLQAYSFFGVLFAIILAIFLLYAFFQALVWGALLRTRTTWRSLLRYVLYLLVVLVVLPVVSVPFLLLVFLCLLLFTFFAKASGILVILLGALIALLGYSCLLPFAFFPSHAFFVEKKIFPSIGRMFFLAFTTLPRLWKHHLLGGLVFLIVSQLYWLIGGLDQALGGFLLLVLIISPVLAWYRLHILALIPRRTD